MRIKDIAQFFTILKEQSPEPKGELNYTNPYTLLVAVALSAQATDIGVNKATEALFKVVSTPDDMIKLGEANLKSYIKTIGLYNSKAKNIIAASHILKDQHNSIVPQDRVALEKLPGVGRKTANVVLSMAFGIATIAVDTHVFRVANRTKMAIGKTPIEVETKLERRIPKEFLFHAHHWLILHGRYICKARKPECQNCTVKELCGYKAKLL